MDRERSGPAPQRVKAVACAHTPEKGRATREAAVDAYLDAVERGCVEELAALFTPHNFVPDGGKNGHQPTRVSLRQMVDARCGLRLTDRDIEWGPKEPYGLDATIEYYDAKFSAAVDPAPGKHARFHDNAHVDHVKTKAGNRWFVDPVMPSERMSIEKVPGEGKCFHLELLGRVEAVVKAREAGDVDDLPIAASFRPIVKHEIGSPYAVVGADDFVAALPNRIVVVDGGHVLVNAQTLVADLHGDSGSYGWYEAVFVKEKGEWVIASMAEEGEHNSRIEWASKDSDSNHSMAP